MLVRFHMHENYGLVRGIEKLVLRGRIEDAALFAAAIAEAPEEPGLGAYAAQAAKVRSSAAELAKAKQLDQAARATAHLAQACASCHTAAGIDAQATPSLPPPDRDTLDARMARHLWAAEQLWSGMIGNDDVAWKAGIQLIATSKPLRDQLTTEQQALGRRLQKTAERALRADAKQIATRANVYGELLLTCASCHTAPH